MFSCLNICQLGESSQQLYCTYLSSLALYLGYGGSVIMNVDLLDRHLCVIQVSNLEVQRAEDNNKVVVTATGSSGESAVEVSAAV